MDEKERLAKMQEYHKYAEEHRRTDYLKVDELEEGWLYRIHARNAEYGVWYPQEQGFVIRRLKFREIYTFVEIHWDLSDDFGTVKPFYKLERSPFTHEQYKSGQHESEMLEWLRFRTEHWETYV